jgi:hypothetical protein
MTGLNRALIEDEKTFCKSINRIISYNASSLVFPIITTQFFPTSSGAQLTIYTNHYYQNNTLYFLNSTNNINMDLDLYDFTESEDVDNALDINNKKTFRIVVKGLGIPANFSTNITINPNSPNPSDGDFIYQIGRDTLGISEWEKDSSEDTTSDKNRALFAQLKRAWLGRLHGDIIDMAFYFDTGE